MKGLFRLDGPLMTVMSQITDCIFLSLFFLLGCIPVVTIGTSFASLYDSVFRGMRRGEKNSWQRFFHTFRQNWKAGILPTVLFLILMYALGFGMIQCWNNAVYGNCSWMVFAAVALLGAAAAGILSILFPMLSRFENTAMGLLKNTLVLGLANLPRTVALGILNVCSAMVCVRFIFPLFFLPGLAALLGSFLIEPIFRPFMPEEDCFEEAAD